MTGMVGSIVYDTRSGLGLLAKAFFDHGLIQRVLVVPHPHYERYPEWYSSEVTYTEQTYIEFLDGLTTLFLFENAFGPTGDKDTWHVVSAAKRRGIRVVMMPMYEYSPLPPPVPADLYLCPSLLDLQYYEHPERPSVFIPVPVEATHRMRHRAHTFVHNAGHGGKNWRNGTPELLEALRHVKSPIKLIVRGQPDEEQVEQLFRKQKWDPRLELVLRHVDDSALWEEGDVFIFPEKFNGLSLPLQEAFASGMLVMAGHRFPINSWLPSEPLIPISSYVPDRLAVKFQRAVYDPRVIAQQIDDWYGRDISQYSLRGREWAQQTSWEALAPQYQALLHGDT